jgi:hypothetical protein
MLVTWINYPVWNKVIQAKSVCVRIRFPSILPVIDLRKLECYKIEHTLRKTQLISLSRTFVPFQVRNSRSAHLGEAKYIYIYIYKTHAVMLSKRKV